MGDMVGDIVESFLIDNMPRLRNELADYADEGAASTDTNWDDRGARLIRAFMGL